MPLNLGWGPRTSYLLLPSLQECPIPVSDGYGVSPQDTGCKGLHGTGKGGLFWPGWAEWWLLAEAAEVSAYAKEEKERLARPVQPWQIHGGYRSSVNRQKKKMPAKSHQ